MFKVLVFILAFSMLPARGWADEDVDVELVLAVDISGSMDIDEARVQRSGYLNSLRHPDFLNAVKSGRLGRIAISYFEWAGRINEDSVIPWQVIDDAGDVQAFTTKLQARPIGTRRATSVSTAILFGTSLIDTNAFSGVRRIIDISGDGPNNTGPPVIPVRASALARGIIINGLAIMVRPSVTIGPLDRYFGDCVIGGPGSFVLSVHEAEDFAVAIRQKLILEVSGRSPPAHIRLANDVRTDCFMGEKLYPGFPDQTYPELGR